MISIRSISTGSIDGPPSVGYYGASSPYTHDKSKTAAILRESLFAKIFKSLLQQNRPKAGIVLLKTRFDGNAAKFCRHLIFEFCNTIGGLAAALSCCGRGSY
jgi:hypothetical protein